MIPLGITSLQSLLCVDVSQSNILDIGPLRYNFFLIVTLCRCFVGSTKHSVLG